MQAFIMALVINLNLCRKLPDEDPVITESAAFLAINGLK